MALSANTVWEVQIGGNDNNGGGFVTGSGGTDYSLVTTPRATLSTASVVNAATTKIDVSAGDYICGAGDVGNILQITGGTATVGWYQITAQVGQQWTLDRAVGTAGQTVVGRMGGCFASPAIAAAAATVAFMIVFIKYNATAFIATTATVNVAGGCASPTGTTYWAGYDTTRSLLALGQNRPTFRINSGVSAATLFGNLNASYFLQSMILDGNSQTTSRCYNSSGTVVEVKAMNAVSGGIVQNSSNAVAAYCEVTGCTVGISMSICEWCVAHDNPITAALDGAFKAGSVAYNCIAYGNTRNGFSTVDKLINCVAYNNSECGFYTLNDHNCTFINCIAEGNGQYGFATNVGSFVAINCAAYNNTLGRSNAAGGKVVFDKNPINGSGSFFVAAASADFRLNSTAGAGALARAAGFPGAFPPTATATINYSDLGAAQHQDSGGGGGGPVRLVNRIGT